MIGGLIGMLFAIAITVKAVKTNFWGGMAIGFGCTLIGIVVDGIFRL